MANVWRSWFKFKIGKRNTMELENFTYLLENNLHSLYSDINNGDYKHGGYKKFVVTDNKRREIRIADIRDRVVHRLLYEYLYKIYNQTFIFDLWSCRKEKGLLGAIERVQKFLSRYPGYFIWRADINKFFDNVDQPTLLSILSLRVTDGKAIHILQEVIESYSTSVRERERESKSIPSKGIPIGNLTSQIFANIYLNELDRLVKHYLRPRAYLRYGDDFVIISENLENLKQIRAKIIEFLKIKLKLRINAKNDIMIKSTWGLKFLGCWIYPNGRKLNKRNWFRVKDRLDYKNISSYSGLVKQHSKDKRIKEFNWIILQKLHQYNN